MAECSNVNVQVAVRCRPLNSREKTAGNLHVVNTEPSHNRIRVAHKKLDRTYQYDHVFGPFASQEEVFTSTVEPIVREMLQGYSTTVFAYGQTGTGKTHTMEGDITSAENMGVIPRSVHAIFNYLDSISADYTVRTSFLELYNEELQDLLADGSSKSKVVLREDTKRGVVCCGLEEVQVLTAKDIFAILGRGIQQRKTAETLMNKNSSRSHSIFTLKIMIKECMPDGQEVMRNGQLNLVDLAGSECVGRSGAKNARAREAGNINQSLLTLGRVITALVEHHPHVPYRDSKLTRLLQESLGGRAKTCIIATVTASSDALEETLSSLDYALKAKSIENKPVANQKLSKTHLLKEYAGEVESLRSMLQASRDKNGVYVEPWRFEQMENTLSSQTNQITEMEAILTSRNDETKELKAERDAFRSKGEKLEEELEASKGREEATTARLTETEGRLERTEEDLASSRAHAAQLQRDLVATKNTLKATEEELAATRAVVAEQAATEHALRAEADQTKASLVDAERDVGGLHAKVTRQGNEAAEKRTHAVAFGEEATVATAEVSDAVARFAGEHSKGCEELRKGLVKAEAASRAATGGLSAAAADALGEVDRRCREIAKGVADGAASADGLLSVAVSVLEEALNGQKDALAEWSSELEVSLGALRQGLESHEGDLTELSDDVRRRAKEAETEMTHFKDKCASELAAVRSWADERIAAQTEQMELQSEEAKVVAAMSKEETAAEVAQLMQSLSSLMSGLQTNAAARADRQAEAAGEAWSQSISAARSLGPEVSRKMGGIAESVASGSEILVEKLAASSSATGETIEEHQKTAVAFAASAAAVSAGITAGAVRSSLLADETGSSLKENLAGVSQAVGATADASATSVETLCGENKAAAEIVAALATAADDKAAGMARETESQLAGLAADAVDMDSSHVSRMGRFVTQIEGHVEEASVVRVPTGKTPDRKRYPRPDRFSVTRPHVDIMSEIRCGNISSLTEPVAAGGIASDGRVAGDAGELEGTQGAEKMEDDGAPEMEAPTTTTSTTTTIASKSLMATLGQGAENSSIKTVPAKTSATSDGGTLLSSRRSWADDAGVDGASAGDTSDTGTAASGSPLGEATNTSTKRAARSKIPTSRRPTRRTRIG